MLRESACRRTWLQQAVRPAAFSSHVRQCDFIKPTWSLSKYVNSIVAALEGHDCAIDTLVAPGGLLGATESWGIHEPMLSMSILVFVSNQSCCPHLQIVDKLIWSAPPQVPGLGTRPLKMDTTSPVFHHTVAATAFLGKSHQWI